MIKNEKKKIIAELIANDSSGQLRDIAINSYKNGQKLGILYGVISSILGCILGIGIGSTIISNVGKNKQNKNKEVES